MPVLVSSLYYASSQSSYDDRVGPQASNGTACRTRAPSSLWDQLGHLSTIDGAFEVAS